MAKSFKIVGIDNVLRKLNREILKIKGRSMVGLIHGTIIIRRDMEKTPPLVPVDWGNLRASWFTIAGVGGDRSGNHTPFRGPQAAKISQGHQKVKSSVKQKVKSQLVVGFGFSAFYAAIVHEKTGPVQWSRPLSGAKFLEMSIDRNRLAILESIRQSARIR